jgi:hypothetical protein
MMTMSSTNSLLSPPNEKDSSKLWNDIVSAFREDGFPNLSNANGAIREELLSLYRRLASSDKEDDDTSTNPSKFVIAWEAFASNNADIKDDVKSIPNAENIESFREYILKDVIDVQKEIMRVGVVGSSKNQKKKKLSKFEKQAQKKARLMTMGEHLEMHDEDVDEKMEVKEEDSAEEEPLLKTPFKETTENNNSMNLPSSFVEMKTPGSYRKAKKKTSETTTLVKTIFEGSFKSSSSSNAEKEITVKIQTSSSPHSTLFMRDRIEDKVALLKNKFKEEEDLKEEEEQEEEEQKGQIIGRVCCDSSDRQELQLESSDGSRVKLELRSVENEYSLFPGQIVKCVGANPTGYCFVAKEIDCYYFKQQQQIKQQQIKEEVQKTEMLLFSGPFTANDDLMYEPLDDVLHEASSKSPSIVLLMGPFVSDENINHALTSNITYKQAFEQIVMKKVEAFAKQYPNKHVVLVPSVKDAFHRYCAFPQPPFFETSKCKNVHFVANPSAFEVNGIRVAVSTCDILKHLSGFERGGKGKTTTEQQQQQQTDRMTRLCSHMVGQMSMYPLFPPHPDAKFESHDATVPLRVGMDERVPDLIVLTSDLAAGGWKNALSGNKTMFVNPGKVCRGVNAGTFCKISSSSGENFAESARLELHKL